MGAWSQWDLWDCFWPIFASQEGDSEGASNSGTSNDAPQLEMLGVGVIWLCWWTAELGQPSCGVWAPHEAGGAVLPWHLSPGTVPSPAFPTAATAVEYTQVTSTSARLQHMKATRSNSQYPETRPLPNSCLALCPVAAAGSQSCASRRRGDRLCLTSLEMGEGTEPARIPLGSAVYMTQAASSHCLRCPCSLAAAARCAYPSLAASHPVPGLHYLPGCPIPLGTSLRASSGGMRVKEFKEQQSKR